MSENYVIAQLQLIREQQEKLREDYQVWMRIAAERGISSTKVAKSLGLSETAVRLYRKRKGISGD